MSESEGVPNDVIWPGYVPQSSRPVRLVLIDDHQLVREGICALLALESDLRVVGQAANIDAGIEMVRQLSPDLVICDLNMPGCTGGLAVKRLNQECPNIRVLVLTAHDSFECIRESFTAGATGYVHKDALRAELLRAVRNAAAGLQAMCPGVGDIVVRHWLQGAPPEPIDPRPDLSAQDKRIIRMIALGVPTWRIAADLDRNVKVVEKYRTALMRRLQLNNSAAVARFAVQCNFLSNEEVDQLVSAE